MGSYVSVFLVFRPFQLPLPTDLPFYRKYPKATGAGLGIVGTTLLAPIAIVGVLSAVGFTSAGIAAGILNPLSFPSPLY